MSQSSNLSAKVVPNHTARFPFSRLIALVLFLVALPPRLPGLGLFLTSDENTNIFFAGSDVIAAFLRGDLRDTYWHFYPGVTMSWLDAVGMAGQYWLDRLAGRPVAPFTDYIYGDILSLLVANRLPYAVLTAAAIPASYLLARKLLPEAMALLGALFLAFDPFFLAHSRVAHADAPVAVFMSLSALAFFVFGRRIRSNRPDDSLTTQPGYPFASAIAPVLRWPSFSYLLLSAVLGGLAALTKAPGQFMALFVIGMAIIYAALEWRRVDPRGQPPTRAPQNGSNILLRWFSVIISWGLVSLVTFVLLWPSMWVDPVGTLRQMLDETFGKVNEGHLVYFFGQPTLDPGPWFYLYVIPFRLTPIILVGVLLSLLLFIPTFSFLPKIQRSEIKTIYLLWLFTIALLLFGNLSPKKQDRYLLPLFPFLNLLAAAGWLGLFYLVYNFIFSTFLNNRHHAPRPTPHSLFEINRNQPRLSLVFSTALILFLVVLHSIPIFTYYPYYLTYFNPLMGGPSRAAETTLMGWGEGMEQVAAYLNTKPNAADLYVASTPSQTLLPYFAGTGENFYTNDVAFRADYVVLYLAQMQRLAPSPDIVRYFEAQSPEKVVTIKQVPYAKIYRGPKLIRPDIPPGATPANIGLDNTIRLAGYQLQDRSQEPQMLTLTLYWHALAPISTNYTVSIRARTADGRLVAQRDSWPVDGLLPTSQWRQGDYVADPHTLEISASEGDQVDEIEIVLYNLGTGETLGPPITLPTNHGQLSMNNCQ